MSDPYVVTPACGLAVTEQVLDGNVSAGYQTPAAAFDPEFVLGIDEAAGFFDEDDPS
jgi:short subunit dehydrogenase-like uncharacterized protein